MSETTELKHYTMHARHVVDELYWVWCHHFWMGPFHSDIDAFNSMKEHMSHIQDRKVKNIYGPVMPVIIKICTDNNGEMESFNIGLPYESDAYESKEVCLVKAP